MKTCPQCSFLMGDDETLCAACTSQPARAFPIDSYAAESATAGSTLLLDPSTITTGRESVRYRNPVVPRSRVGLVVVAVVVLAAAVVLGGLGLSGTGPLASTAVSLGLADPAGVAIPQRWTTVVSDEGGYTASLPAGAERHDQPIDPMLPQVGSLHGHEVSLGSEAEMLVASTDFGLGAEQVRALDDAAFSVIVDELIRRIGLGEETVRRPGVVSSGRALDSVLVDGEDSTTRARFLLDGGRLHLLLTRGSEDGARQLNEAHARLIDGYSAAT